MPAAPRRGRAFSWAGDGFWLGVGAVAFGLGAVLLARLHALPPNEDEVLAFFISHGSLGEVLETVLGERGGAPLHYLLAYLAGQVDPGLTSLRLISVAFAVGSVPVAAAVVARLSDRRTALLASIVAAASWTMLYHGIYARMYSLFLFTSVLSLLLLLRSLERSTRGRWAAWAAATLALLAAQPYGVLVLAAQFVYVAVLRIRRPLPLQAPLIALGAIVVLAGPLWRSYFVLASRFEIGLGSGSGSELGSPVDVIDYLWDILGDFTTGWFWVALPLAVVCTVGFVVLARSRAEPAMLTAAIAAVPVIALVAARSGAAASLETRHLIFVLPFTAMLFVLGLRWLAAGGGRAGPAIVAVALVALVALEVAWGLDRTRWLYTGEPDSRAEAREDAAEWLAATGQPDDVLLGFEPTYLDAWEEGAPFGDVLIPRADPKLELDALEDVEEPLGRGVWVLDASDELDQDRVRLEIPLRTPGAEFEARAFGPFLIVRTLEPVGDAESFLEATLRVQQLSAELEIGDAGRNYATAEAALKRLRDGG